MADENVVEQKQPQNPVNQIATEVGLPKQPQTVPGPSSIENQQETQESKKFNDQVKKKQALIKRNFGKEPSYSEAQHMVIEDIKTNEEKRKTKEAEDLLRDQQVIDKEKIEKEARLEKYLSGKKFAEENPNLVPNFQVDEEMESMLAQQQHENQSSQQQAFDKVQADLKKQQEMEAMQRQQEVEQEKAAIRKEENVAEAKVQRQNEKVQEQKEQQEADQTKVEERNEAVKNIDSGRFWKNLSTGDKIIAAIAVGLSGIGSGLTGQQNQALAMINKHIDADLKDQKLSYDEKLAKKQEAYNRQINNLKLQGEQLKNQNMKIKAAEMLQGMEQKRAEIISEQLLREKKLGKPTACGNS